jgi:hypothetical protein
VPVCCSQKPLPHKFAASAWFATIGPTERTNDSAATTNMLNVSVVFAFTDICNIFSTCTMVFIIFIGSRIFDECTTTYSLRESP